MSKELREKFNASREAGMKIQAEATKEGRKPTAEEKAEMAKHYANCQAIREEIESEKQWAGMKLNEALAAEKLDSAKVTKESHKAALNTYLRTGQMPHMLATMIAGPVPDGSPGGTVGVSLPASEPVFIKRQKNPFLAALQYYGLTPIQTDGFTNVPIIDLTGSSVDAISQAYVGDNAKNDAVTNLLPATNLFDSGTRWISDLLVRSVPNILDAYVQPLRDVVELKSAANMVATMTTGGGAAGVGVTTAGTSAFTYQELVNWKFSLAAEYQNDAVIFASTGFMQAVYGLVDDNNMQIYIASLSDDSPDRLFGAPIFMTSALQNPGAGHVSAVIASASSLIVTQNGAQRVLRYEGESEHPMQTGLRVIGIGGNGFVSNGVKLLKNAAS
jgi:hypothetical protein